MKLKPITWVKRVLQEENSTPMTGIKLSENLEKEKDQSQMTEVELIHKVEDDLNQLEDQDQISEVHLFLSAEAVFVQNARKIKNK